MFICNLFIKTLQHCIEKNPKPSDLLQVLLALFIWCTGCFSFEAFSYLGSLWGKERVII